jgi:hypothetical protein
MRIRHPWILVLALLAFAFGRLTGAHLHMCFDGSEPPLSLHTSDGTHLEHHAGEEHHHDDVDVEPLGDLLAKNAQVVLLAVVAAGIWVIALIAPWRPVAIAAIESRPLRPPPRFLRPPLRAPPR